MTTKSRALKSKISPVSSAKTKLAKIRKKKIVFTNGCFDILHRGHVTYLEKARALGDFLVVALNDDDSVRKLKGPTRPVNTLMDRAHVMAALECVDLVTWFSEDTPLEAIKALQPDVLVKGGDWKVDEIVGAKEVKSWGGKVKSISFVEGQSTTQIIERAQK